MTTAVIRTVEFAKPVFTKPSPATLRRVETILTVTLLAQTIGLVIRYTM